MKGDFYLYCSNGRGMMLAATDKVDGGEEEMDEETARALMEKEAESEAYQQKRIEQMRAKPRTSVHKVKAGDTLSSIAHKYGTTVDRLCRLNNIKKTSVLRLGQILRYS